jgi:hypothetical protein
MSVTAVKLKQPAGELEPSLFPAEDIDARLAAYIADGESRAAGLSGDAKDLAVTAWAYYRAYDAIVKRLSGNPSEASVDSGKSRYKYSPEQVVEFKTSRAGWLSIFDSYFPTTTGASVGVAQMNNPLPLCSLCRSSNCLHLPGVCR